MWSSNFVFARFETSLKFTLTQQNASELQFPIRNRHANERMMNDSQWWGSGRSQSSLCYLNVVIKSHIKTIRRERGFLLNAFTFTQFIHSYIRFSYRSLSVSLCIWLVTYIINRKLSLTTKYRNSHLKRDVLVSINEIGDTCDKSINKMKRK